MAEHGLQQQADLIAFAGHAMACRGAFDRHPRLNALFEELRASGPEGELDYRELSARITPQEWQEIAQDINARQGDADAEGRVK
jgi:L-asparaginase/Glu-tRNA(Gln) amidotransferase subunit D